jgi:hypothetical protein
MVRWDHLFAVDGDVSPVVNYLVKSVDHGIMSLHGACAEGAPQRMMPLGITMTGTPVSIGALKRAGARFENVIAKSHSDR